MQSEYIRTLKVSPYALTATLFHLAEHRLITLKQVNEKRWTITGIATSCGMGCDGSGQSESRLRPRRQPSWRRVQRQRHRRGGQEARDGQDRPRSGRHRMGITPTAVADGEGARRELAPLDRCAGTGDRDRRVRPLGLSRHDLGTALRRLLPLFHPGLESRRRCPPDGGGPSVVGAGTGIPSPDLDRLGRNAARLRRAQGPLHGLHAVRRRRGHRGAMGAKVRNRHGFGCAGTELVSQLDWVGAGPRRQVSAAPALADSSPWWSRRSVRTRRRSHRR